MDQLPADGVEQEIGHVAGRSSFGQEHPGAEAASEGLRQRAVSTASPREVRGVPVGRRAAGRVAATSSVRDHSRRPHYFVELTLTQFLRLCTVLLLAHGAGLLALYSSKSAEIKQHFADCANRHATAVNLLTAEFQQHKTMWEHREKQHQSMKRECEQIAMNEQAQHAPAKNPENDLTPFLGSPQTVLHANAHLCPRIDCPLQEADQSLRDQVEYLKTKLVRLESKHDMLKSREMQMLQRLPKVAQYETSALPHPWTAHMHPHGRTYYHNHQTGVSSWHDPRQMEPPRVEGCPGLWGQKTMNSEAQSLFSDQSNVAAELWGQGGDRQTVGIATAPQSAAKSSGQPTSTAAKDKVLSEFQAYMPSDSNSPVDDEGQSKSGVTGDAGTSLDTQSGARRSGQLLVSVPILVAPAEHHEWERTRKTIHKGQYRKYSLDQSAPNMNDAETAAEQGAFVGDLRMVRLDGDRLWLSVPESTTLPWESSQRLAFPEPNSQDRSDQAPSSPEDFFASRDHETDELEVESIQLWKAKLEVIYPDDNTTESVSELLWGHSGPKDNLKTTTERSGDTVADEEQSAQMPFVFQKPFTRWSILDRMSRFWVFQSRSSSEARDWVVSISHNMALVDSSRIRPSHFHFFPSRPAESTPRMPKMSSSTVETGQKHAEDELERIKRWHIDSKRKLKECLKAQRRRQQCPTSGISSAVFRTLASPAPLPTATMESDDSIAYVAEDEGEAARNNAGEAVRTLTGSKPSVWLKSVQHSLSESSLEKAAEMPAASYENGPQRLEDRVFKAREKERVHGDFKRMLTDAGAKIDDTCPALYSRYVSFLRAQAKAPQITTMCVLGFGLGHIPLHLLAASSTATDQVEQSGNLIADLFSLQTMPIVLAIDEFANRVQRQAAAFLAGTTPLGRRFLALQGDVGNTTAQLIAEFPTLICDLSVIIPASLLPLRAVAVPGRLDAADDERKVRQLILCASALSAPRSARARGNARDSAHNGGAEADASWVDSLLRQDSSETRENGEDSSGSGHIGQEGQKMLLVDGYPCGTPQCALVGRVWNALVAEGVVQHLAKFPLESGRHGFVVGRFLVDSDSPGFYHGCI